MPVDPQDILTRLRQEPAPLPFPKLKKAFVSKKSGVSEADLRAALAHPEIFPWTKPKNSYWHLDPQRWLEDQILAACHNMAVEKLPIKGPSKKDIDAAVTHLLAQAKLVYYPAVEGKKKVLVAAANAQAAYWAYVRSTIEAKLKKAGINPESSLEDKILQYLKTLDQDTPISTARLRQALGITENDKRSFDEAALSLRQQRKVYLSQHDHAFAVSPEERSSLIDGQDGKFYVAITRREQS